MTQMGIDLLSCVRQTWAILSVMRQCAAHAGCPLPLRISHGVSLTTNRVSVDSHSASKQMKGTTL